MAMAITVSDFRLQRPASVGVLALTHPPVEIRDSSLVQRNGDFLNHVSSMTKHPTPFKRVDVGPQTDRQRFRKASVRCRSCWALPSFVPEENRPEARRARLMRSARLSPWRAPDRKSTRLNSSHLGI